MRAVAGRLQLNAESVVTTSVHKALTGLLWMSYGYCTDGQGVGPPLGHPFWVGVYM